MSEKLLWNKFRDGNHEAFEQIYRMHFGKLFAYGKKFDKNDSHVEDCIQELFIELWNSRSTIGETDAILPYLYVCLRRKIVKETKRRTAFSDKEITQEHFDHALSIEDTLINAEIDSEKKLKLSKAFGLLSSRQKEIIYLRYTAELDYDQIGELLDLNYQSARNLLSRAIQKLTTNMTLSILFVLFFVN